MNTLQELERLTQQALQAAGASLEQAGPTARALVAAEAQGLASHGLSRVPMYAGHLRAGRVMGNAVPKIIAEKPAAVLVDAQNGFAFPACALAVQQAIQRARACGIAIGAVTNSHHFGVAAYHLRPIAEAGMVGLAFGNSPAAMPAAGGQRAIFGTNPIAATFPRAEGLRRAGRDRPVAVRSRARQDHGRGEEGRSRSRSAGRSTRRAGRPPMRKPRWPARCCRWAAPRARCWRSSSNCS